MRFKLLSVALLVVGLSGCAVPGQLPVGSISPMPPILTANSSASAQAHFIPERGQAAMPLGFQSFCLRFPDQCQEQAGAPHTIALTDEVWTRLQDTNVRVNRAIWPEEDERHYGRAEYWTIPTDGYGDCEDIALTKRRDLIASGLPEPALRIAVVDTPREERHAVLTIATDKGDLVLDNLRDEISTWDRTGYTWIERQDPSDSSKWIALLPQPRMLVLGSAAPVAQIH